MAGPFRTLFVVWAASLSAVEGNAFLGMVEPASNRNFEPLLEELEGILDDELKAKVERRVGTIMESLQPTFAALPKLSEGYIEPAAVRYLLHRYFVDRHGWFVQGFESAGDAWNSSSPASFFGEHLSSGTQDVFEERLAHRGLSLHEAAVLAATLEGLIHSETLERLHAAFQLAGLSKADESAEGADVDLAMQTYMLMYVLGLKHSAMTPARVNLTLGKVDLVYPNWNETMKWVRGVREEVMTVRSLTSDAESEGSFGTAIRVLEEVADRYGHWQDQECSNVKDTLVRLERPGTGRVPLATFYEAALNGSWFLSETKAYLRQTGALDEGDPNQPTIIIPNYVNGNSNCIASSKFYAVCCINECEALLGQVERQLASPTAEPSRIIDLVSQLPSATVEAPRKLPAALVERLDEISAHHGGKVPLHGRLFMQWLHHAYPRECPFPHLSGVSKPVTAQQWKEQTGEKATADKETMQWHIDEARRSFRRASDVVANPLFDGLDELPWLSQEELFISHPTPRRAEPLVSVIVKGVLLAALACSLMISLMAMTTQTRDVQAPSQLTKFSV